jgi:hypothetical protein
MTAAILFVLIIRRQLTLPVNTGRFPGSYLKKQQAPFRYSCMGIQPYANISSLFEQAKTLGVHYRLAEDVILGGLDAYSGRSEQSIR